MSEESASIITTGLFLKTSRLEYEFYQKIVDPEEVIRNIQKSKAKSDIFTFMQNFPESIQKYNYYREWDNLAVIKVDSYEDWFKNKIKKSTRKAIRRSAKNIEVSLVQCTDALLKGIQQIFNETPIRQGKPFWHYNKSLEDIKKDLTRDLNIFSHAFIGAYYNDELIGFIKILHCKEWARTVQIISKIKHRDKYPNNGLISKAVEFCESNKIPYLIYGKYSYGKKGSSSLTDFKHYSGFEQFNIPRYYVPLSLKGKMALKMKLHHGIEGILSEKIIESLLNVRNRYFSNRVNK